MKTIKLNVQNNKTKNQNNKTKNQYKYYVNYKLYIICLLIGKELKSRLK